MRNTNFFIMGLAGTGKDTVAEILKEKFGIEPYRLGDGPRRELARFTGITDFRKHRSRLIDVGQTYKELYYQDVWCDALMERVAQRNSSQMPIGISVVDGRYEHEYTYFVTKRRFVPIRLVVDDALRIERMIDRGDNIDFTALQFEKDNFIPESNFAFVIDNNKNFEDLESRVTKLAEGFIYE